MCYTIIEFHDSTGINPISVLKRKYIDYLATEFKSCDDEEQKQTIKQNARDINDMTHAAIVRLFVNAGYDKVGCDCSPGAITIIRR